MPGGEQVFRQRRRQFAVEQVGVVSDAISLRVRRRCCASSIQCRARRSRRGSCAGSSNAGAGQVARANPYSAGASDLRAEATLGYTIEWDGHAVTLPAMGELDDGVSFTSWDDAELQLARYAVAMFNAAPEGQTQISVPVVLIPRPDNEYDDGAVSVAAPRSMGGDKDVRHLGFLYRRFLDWLPDNAIPQLAELSDGEIHCTAIIERDEDNYDGLDFDDPDDLPCAYGEIKLALPRGGDLARAIAEFLSARRMDLDDEGRQRTNHVLERLRTFETASRSAGPLSVTVREGIAGQPSSLTVHSGDTPIGSVALGFLFLEDERLRPAVLDGLRQLGVPAVAPQVARPEAASQEWESSAVPNVHVDWRPGGLKLRWAEPDGPSTRTTFAQYNPTTKTLWVEDQRLVAPACVFAARLGLEVAEIGLPPLRWTLKERVWRGHLRDLSYE